MEKIRVVEPGQKLRSKDRDGPYKRRDYWHYELIIDGRKRSFTTATRTTAPPGYPFKSRSCTRALGFRDCAKLAERLGPARVE